MFLPIGDSPNPPDFRPWVTWGLIAANVAVFVLFAFPLGAEAPQRHDPQLRLYVELLLGASPTALELQQLLGKVSAYDLFLFAHGYKPGLPALHDLFSAMFLHAGPGHLAGNMLFLWIYGDNVEHRLGRLGYLVTYLLCGAVSTWSFAVFAAEPYIPLVGASGAISGVLGLYFVFFPRNRVRVLLFWFPIVRTFFVPARLLLGFYVLIDNLLPFLGGVASGVAYGAHLGGFFAGVGVAVAGPRLRSKFSKGRSGVGPVH